MTEKEEKKITTTGDQAELGLYLRALREKKGLELFRLAELLGVSEKILQALEQGQTKFLPPDSYLQGILKKYARYFRLDYNELRLLSRQQFPSRFSGAGDTLPGNRFGLPGQNLRLMVSPSLGSWVLLLLFVYLGLQIVQLVLPVRIRLQESYALSQTTPLLLQGKLQGKVRAFFINDQRVKVEDNGFSFSLFLNPGPNSVELVAENYLGRETTVRKVITLTAALVSSSPTPAASPTPLVSPLLPSADFSPLISPSF